MVHEINTVVLSGEVTWVKKKYAKNENFYVIFALRQCNKEWKDGRMIGKSDDVFFVTCFNDAAMKAGYMKEGDVVFIQGRIVPYLLDDGKVSFNIMAEKVLRYGNKVDDNDRNKEQASGSRTPEAPI